MRLTGAQVELLAWLYTPGERYVFWKEWRERRWGAILVDRNSTYPRRPRVIVTTALNLLRRGFIAQSHRDENGPFCEITEQGRKVYARHASLEEHAQ